MRSTRYPAYTPHDRPTFNELPSHWDVVRGRHLVKIQTGSGDTVDATPEGDYPFYVRSDQSLRSDRWEYDTTAVLTAGDGAGVAKVFHLVHGRFMAHQRVYVLSEFRRVTPQYFYFAFSSMFHLIALDGSAKSTVDSVRRPMIADMPFPVPPVEEQQQIADSLDRETARIDTLIEEQQRLIEMLLDRRGAVADQLFNPDAPGFPLKRFVEEVTVGIVVNPSAWYVQEGVPALRGLNVRPGHIISEDLVYLSLEGDARHKKSRLRAGDVVVVRTGQAGAAAVIPPDMAGVNAIDLLIVRPGPHVDSNFLAAYINAPSTKSKITQGSVGAIQGHFNVGALRELEFPTLDVVEQRRCAEEWLARASAIDTLIAETKKFIGLSQERRSALVTAAVTGRIDVREVV
ncbi:restriction endonuclease subunit S [Rhodococcus sp. NPDC055024]